MASKNKSALIAGGAIAVALGCATAAFAQTRESVRDVKAPLVLKSRGSFFVGGQSVVEDDVSAGQAVYGNGVVPPGHLTVNQMYVEYMVPDHAHAVPVVMVHGATLSAKSYDTTPDGRMGWYEYFVRRGHPAYLVDQVSRGRSGFDQSLMNKVRAGSAEAATLPNFKRFSDEISWYTFRFGAEFGVPHADEQFPVEALAEFSKQGIPDLNGLLPTPNPTYRTLADLGSQLKGAIIMGHSQAGLFPEMAALTDPNGIKGVVSLEPGGCNSTKFTDDEIEKLASLPILLVFGDHLDDDSHLGARVSWTSYFADCQAFVKRVNDVKGKVTMLHIPDLGIHGNSHMFMLDKNNLQIADLVMKWMDREVR